MGGRAWQVTEAQRTRILGLLTRVYGRDQAHICYDEIERLMRVFYAHKPEEIIADDARFERANRFTEKDVVLTTYGDLILANDEAPLETLTRMLDRHARYVTAVHVLPFFPYSSDRGFSVIDYEEVDPNLGSWDAIEELAGRFELMFDGVVNHVSAKSRWFQEFLNGNPRYREFFIGFSTREEIDEEHLKLILRPRATTCSPGSRLLTDPATSGRPSAPIRSTSTMRTRPCWCAFSKCSSSMSGGAPT